MKLLDFLKEHLGAEAGLPKTSVTPTPITSAMQNGSLGGFFRETVGVCERFEVRIPLRDRHAAADTERSRGDFEARCGLGALVFVEVNTALNPAHGFFLEASSNDVARALVFLNVKLENLIKDVIGR